MDLESVIQSEGTRVKEVRKRKQIPYANTHIGNQNKTKQNKGSDEPKGRTGIKMQT